MLVLCAPDGLVLGGRRQQGRRVGRPAEARDGAGVAAQDTLPHVCRWGWEGHCKACTHTHTQRRVTARGGTDLGREGGAVVDLDLAI